MLIERLTHYAYLMRLHKPIGILLLLWPTLWALWLAAHGQPDSKILFIFIAGVLLMRSAGCILNDFADRHIDVHVERTKMRPLATGKISARSALLLAASLMLIAFLLVLQCNILTILLAIAGAMFAVIYPLLKRITHLPQLGLGVAYNWGIPMAFAAITGSVPTSAWFLFLAAMFWPLIYDTQYAMVDRQDDLKIGVKSTAILFAAADKLVIGLLQITFVCMLMLAGILFTLPMIYYISLILVCILFFYQQWLIRMRDTNKCFNAFLNNNWVGLIIFAGILMSYQ